MTEAGASEAPPVAVRELLGLTVNPCDRLWRYPLGHAVVRAALRTPLTPNHVTIGHTLLGISTGFMIATGRPAWLVAAGLLYEVRSVLDCFDGVLARARKVASPYGRAMDQTGDFLSFAAMIIGSGVAIARTLGAPAATVLVLVTSALSATCTLCWDFYKRRFSSLLVDGRDEIGDAYRSLEAESRTRGGFALGFSLFLARAQLWFFDPAGVAGARTARDTADDATVQRLRQLADARDPGLRRALLRVGASGGDTAIFILTVSIALTRPLEGFFAASVYCVAILVATVAASNRLLRVPAAPASHP